MKSYSSNLEISSFLHEVAVFINSAQKQERQDADTKNIIIKRARIEKT
jgi:hypothetical protein